MTQGPLARLDGIFARHADALDSEMRRAVPGDGRSPLYRMLRYHLGWADAEGRPTAGVSGKRLRPNLLLLATEAAGGDPAVAMPAAAAVELLHNFSLIHDDIQDQSRERHGREVVWSIWGTEQAINAGDALHAIAALSALRGVEVGAGAEASLEVAAMLHRCCLRLVEGQYLDLAFERRDDVTPDDYLAMIDGKTGALLVASIEIGAVLGGGRARLAEWRDFGRHLGRSFQIVDDLLGVWGDARITGKPAADDVVRAKRSLPFIAACARLPAPEASRLRELYNLAQRGAAEVGEATALMERSGARAIAQADAREHLTQALRALNATGAEGDGAQNLRHLARFIVERDR